VQATGEGREGIVRRESTDLTVSLFSHGVERFREVTTVGWLKSLDRFEVVVEVLVRHVLDVGSSVEQGSSIHSKVRRERLSCRFRSELRQLLLLDDGSPILLDRVLLERLPVLPELVDDELPLLLSLGRPVEEISVILDDLNSFGEGRLPFLGVLLAGEILSEDPRGIDRESLFEEEGVESGGRRVFVVGRESFDDGGPVGDGELVSEGVVDDVVPLLFEG